MRKLKPLIITADSTGGSVLDGLRLYKKMLKANTEGREIIVKINSTNATAARWRA